MIDGGVLLCDGHRPAVLTALVVAFIATWPVTGESGYSLGQPDVSPVPNAAFGPPLHRGFDDCLFLFMFPVLPAGRGGLLQLDMKSQQLGSHGRGDRVCSAVDQDGFSWILRYRSYSSCTILVDQTANHTSGICGPIIKWWYVIRFCAGCRFRGSNI